MRQPAVERKLSLLLVVLLGSALGSGCLGFGKKKRAPDESASVAPDKVLFERAMNDIKHSRYTVGRLSLQTLINTYPDSEYLAKAKLAIADSYYKEGGTTGLTESVAEYKDFITFFPFLDEAQYAQMQVAMAHYRMMEKPDRDRTQALGAEDEFQTYLLKYPQSPLAAQADQRLREVQEVLAEGDYRVAHFYYVNHAYRAAAARLLELTDRYPLYSQADRANWMLGQVYEKAEKGNYAEKFYERIVRDYPLSSLAGDAKNRLIALGYPVPQPDPGALARLQNEQRFSREKPGILRRSLGMFRSGPDVSSAAHGGAPNLNPPGEGASPSEVLSGGTNLSVGTNGGSGSGGPGGPGNSVSVERVPEGSSSSSPPAANAPSGATNGSAASPTPDSPAPAASPTEGQKSADPMKGPTAKHKKGKESSSKKKKGLRKLIPW